MNVYILFDSHDYFECSVHSTLTKAIEHRNNLVNNNPTQPNYIDEFVVEEKELDPPLPYGNKAYGK